MILAQNRQQQLSGNKFWCVIFLSCFLLACSPKVTTQKTPKKEEAEKPEAAVKAEKKFTEASIALLVPFNLNLASIRSGSKAEMEKSVMAIDFYQGFKMGIDSAAAAGLNFRLKVLDTRDNNDQILSLIKSGQLTGSDLIVGPVFPEGIKFITNYSVANGIPVVSPLAATHPDEFLNPNLISVVNNIDLHAEKIGNFIAKEFDPAKTIVALISTRKSADETLAIPVRSYFKKDKGTKFTFQEYSSVYALETARDPSKQYIVIMSSSDRPFVIATIDKLVKMKNNGMQIDLFGHPNWSKQNYSTEKLQLLNTRITSSYWVDYKNPAVSSFVRKYRNLNHFEPGEYAFKGFDAGFYFGKVMAEHGANYLRYLPSEKYKGLQNSYLFKKDDQLGYINTSLFLLEYKNYALNPVE
ncbi:ABC transporter substrate-binding protein [Pedobacter hartonius]|uniref:ABC-type branched-chain amino acid transport system, substrate-binding protein n=1 Tax=Pedobacter hartonius TaxID=425514 RepID=A0A1H4GUR9_9SPHI|nr:ABC transporter substrate-binding protein [Pedobacter hartonius]SEB13294.1 ABC-type branched-chain amino acid transport system, substrate-binding protein [Pedobacter hartonius]